MTEAIVVPELGESVSEATVSKWFKQEGDAVAKDEPVVELETDKVTMEVSAPADGALKSIKAKEGDTVEIGAVLGEVDAGAKGTSSSKKDEKKEDKKESKDEKKEEKKESSSSSGGGKNPPSVQKMLAENPQVDEKSIKGTGKDGRLKKGDVMAAVEGDGMSVRPASGPREERVKMSKLRQVIAKRLKDSQNTAAILTTFNEIDMSGILKLRNEYKDAFEKKHGVKLGFMGLFAKAAVHALKEIPAVNAEIKGDEVIYKNYYDIGIAVGTPQGLVVPVVRDADKKSIADIESDIGKLAEKAREGTLSMDEMTGGTFTISNGGVYGSLMSTPIINPPQSGILGMHKTEERAVVVKGEIVIRPMMYVALSYDHRIIDGRESVTFLVKVKEVLEDPRRLLLGL